MQQRKDDRGSKVITKELKVFLDNRKKGEIENLQRRRKCKA